MNPWKTPDVSMYHPHIWPLSLMSSAAVKTAPGKSSVVKFGAPALTEFGDPKQASTIPTTPTPNLFSAPRRVTDWAILFVSSSNLVLIQFLAVIALLLLSDTACH